MIKISSDKFLIMWEIFITFGFREVLILLHSLQTVLFWQIAVMFALFACLMILFEDSSIEYAKEFSMQCQIIILVICYNRE